MPVEAVVVNRNTSSLLEDCLESIRKQDYPGRITVWVVDNASSDDSVRMVLDRFPEANLFWNRANTGYAAACNRGAQMSGEPCLLIMNADTVLSPGTISTLARFLEENPSCGAVGPRVLNTDGTLQYSCREFPSLAGAFMHAFFGLFLPDNRYSRDYLKKDWDHCSCREVDWVSGAFMAVRRQAFQQVGGFDEGYHMYVEDVDLCWRLREAGWTVDYVSGGDVVHHIGQSCRLASTRMTFHHHRSMLRFHFRTYRGPARLPVSALVAAGLGARLVLIAALNLVHGIRARPGGSRRQLMPGSYQPGGRGNGPTGAGGKV